jgi:hypothetical protein
MDGEHAFSAALTLVMVNIAFPHNNKDAATMETALSVLRGMAAKGNEYIEARLTLLTNLRSSIVPRASNRVQNTAHPRPLMSFQGPGMAQPFSPTKPPADPTVLPQDSTLQFDNSFQPLQDISFNLDFEEDPKFWEEISGNLDIDIDMDTGWIENALRNETYQGPSSL